jgi:hypothetical protein
MGRSLVFFFFFFLIMGVTKVAASFSTTTFACEMPPFAYSYSSGHISPIAAIATQSGYSDGGPATNAKLSCPFDASGNFYVSDRGSNVIRKINTSGYISTAVGNHSIAHSYSGDEYVTTLI